MLINTFRNFLRHESAAGFALFIAAVAALLVANSPWRTHYQAFFTYPLLNHVINDGLMTIFFLLVSLEIKYELLVGELRSRKRALLPVIAALGGMLVPALLYLLVAAQHPFIAKGWAIPTATDIAFSLAVLSLLGKKIPISLKVFLTALAIIDDLGAIIIIACFYTNHIHLLFLLAAGFCFLLLIILDDRENSKAKHYGYIIVGLALWFCLFKTGIHATIAGVLLGFTVPQKSITKLENTLHPWVSYGILPLFAFANAGVSFAGLSLTAFLNPLTLGIMLGLLVGKQIGVFGASWLMIKTGWAKLPNHANWRQLYGIAVLCGMGFTMSLFIADLAYPGITTHDAAIKLGVLTSSALAAIIGCLILRAA